MIIKSLIVLTAPIFAYLLVIEGPDLAIFTLVDIFVVDLSPLDLLHPGAYFVLLCSSFIAYHLAVGLILLRLRRLADRFQVWSPAEAGLPRPRADLGWGFLIGTAVLCSPLAIVLWIPLAFFLGFSGDSGQQFFSFLIDVALWATGVLAALVCHIRSSQPQSNSGDNT
jgi:hypothetical protein